jgi:hypothetical protein
MIDFIRWAGYFVLAMSILFIAMGIGAVWYVRGFADVLVFLNPFNMMNLVMIVAVLAPGILLIVLAIWLQRRQESSADEG